MTLRRMAKATRSHAFPIRRSRSWAGSPGPGGYAARNLAIKAASTEWIAFLDADDVWMPAHLLSLADAILRNGDDPAIGCVLTGYQEIYRDGRCIPHPYTRQIGRARDRRLDFVELLNLWSRLGSCPVWKSTAAFRRRVLLDAGLLPAGRCSRGGDKDLWLRAARQADLLACPSVSAGIIAIPSIRLRAILARIPGLACVTR